MAVAQQPGQLDDLRTLGVCCPGRGQRDLPVIFTDLLEDAAGAGVHRPSGRVLHPSAPGPVHGGGVQAVQVPDQVVGGPGTVHGDQHVAAVGRGHLSQGRVEHLDVVGRGERPGRPDPVHHRQ